MGPPAGRISSAMTASTNAGRPHCSSGSSIRVKVQADRGDDANRRLKYERNFFRPDTCDSVYKASSIALMRSKVDRQEKDDDQNYLDGCRMVVDFMYALWRDQKLCDVTIKAKDDNIQAHKIALAAHSDFLSGKFNEYTSGEVVMIDMKEFPMTTIMNLLRFVYTTELELNSTSVGPLLRASEELGMTNVREMCLEFLNDLKVDNAIYLFSIAESYNMTDFREKTVRFILDNFVEVSSTDHFVLVPLACLMELLCDDRLNVNSELDVFYAMVRWIEYDRPERLASAPEILGRAVRLQHISPENLVKKVEAVEWLFESPHCQAILFDIYKYQALHLSGSRLAMAFPQQKPRGPR